jgi:hypothetical protein
MQSYNLILILVLILIVGTIVYNCRSEGFRRYGYSKQDIEAIKNFYSYFPGKYPANYNFKLEGYENPYIYPYNYDMNVQKPYIRYKEPRWAQEIQLENTNFLGFPGYVN